MAASDYIYRASDWFDMEEMKEVFSVQAANKRCYPRQWMHVIEGGNIKTFGNKGARTNWLKSMNGKYTNKRPETEK